MWVYKIRFIQCLVSCQTSYLVHVGKLSHYCTVTEGWKPKRSPSCGSLHTLQHIIPLTTNLETTNMTSPTQDEPHSSSSHALDNTLSVVSETDLDEFLQKAERLEEQPEVTTELFLAASRQYPALCLRNLYPFPFHLSSVLMEPSTVTKMA